jgi:DSF synthase
MFDAEASPPRPFRYCVMGSAVPRVFNLGGDLSYFSECIRARDAERLRRYGHACARAVYESSVAYGSPVITIALVQGAALGGGFECALSHDVIVAESGAKFSLPEVTFNMIPGMGAYSFLARRLGERRAEEMITGGRTYSAEDLRAMGLVDVVCPEGGGPAVVQEYIREHSRRFPAQLALYRARRRAMGGVSFEELRDIVDIWVEGVMDLGECDLRTMARLVAAQDKKGAEKRGVEAGAAVAVAAE